MKKLMLSIAVAVIVSGCMSTETQTAIMDKALEVAKAIGKAYAEQYIAEQVEEGNLTSEQAALIKTAVEELTATEKATEATSE